MRFVGRQEGISTYKVDSYYIHVSNKAEALKMLNERKKNELFYVSITYSETTPESSAEGDFSDTGYEEYGYFCSLKDVLNVVKNHSMDHMQRHGNELTVYGEFQVIDYKTGTERQESIHISGPIKAIDRLELIIKETV